MNIQSEMEVHYYVTYSDGGATVRAEAYNEYELYFSNEDTVVVDDPDGVLFDYAYAEPREWGRTAYLTDAGVRVEDSDGAWVPFYTELKTVVADVSEELDALVGAWDMESPS